MKKVISLLAVCTLLLSIIIPINNINFSYAEENGNFVEVEDYNLKRGFLEALNHKKGIIRPVEYQEVMDALFTSEELETLEILSPEVCASHNNQEYTLKISDLKGIEHKKRYLSVFFKEADMRKKLSIILFIFMLTLLAACNKTMDKTSEEEKQNINAEELYAGILDE